MINKRIGFVGPGKMASAIINGLLSGKNIDPKNLYIYGRHPEKMAYFAEFGCNTGTDIQKFCFDSSIIFLCIKPQNFPEVLEIMKPEVSNKNLFVSIAAGISSDFISNSLGFDAKVICAMPNTPLLIGKGATVVSRKSNVSDAEFELVKEVFASCGDVKETDESLLNYVITTSGSSPAFIYLLTKVICDYAAAHGMDRKTALELFCDTLVGAAGMMRETEYSEQELIDMVSSKGGTTIAALNSLYSSGFEDMFAKALDACVKRAVELGER